MPNSIGKDRRGPKGRRFVYHTHKKAWGCIYDTTRDNEAVVMVNEVGQLGLTRRMADGLNAGTT